MYHSCFCIIFLILACLLRALCWLHEIILTENNSPYFFFIQLELRESFIVNESRNQLLSRRLPYQCYLSILQRLVNLRGWERVHLWELSSPQKRTSHGPFAVQSAFSRLWGVQSYHSTQRFTHVIHWQVKWECITKNERKGLHSRKCYHGHLGHESTFRENGTAFRKKSQLPKERNDAVLVDMDLFLLFLHLSSVRCSLLLILCSPMGEV